MNNIQVFNYENTPISFNKSNGVMVNATQMAKVFGKRVNHWLDTQSTYDFIHALAESKGLIPEAGKTASLNINVLASNFPTLIKVVKGGLGQQGTWMHEDVAMEFARWLSPKFAIWCNDRIKELLRFGMTATPDKLDELANNPDLLISLATKLKEERAEKARLTEVNKQQSEQLKIAAPKVEAYDTYITSEGRLTATQIAKEFGWSAKTLNEKLRSIGVQYKQHGQWLLYDKYAGKGYTVSKPTTFTDGNGVAVTRMQTYWTAKGREFIHEIIKQHFDKSAI